MKLILNNETKSLQISNFNRTFDFNSDNLGLFQVRVDIAPQEDLLTYFSTIITNNTITDIKITNDAGDILLHDDNIHAYLDRFVEHVNEGWHDCAADFTIDQVLTSEENE